MTDVKTREEACLPDRQGGRTKDAKIVQAKPDARRTSNRPLSEPSGRPSPAFTFVELMVVSAISGILGLVLLSSLASGMRMWKRAASDNVGYRRAVVLLERMAADFRRAQIMPPEFQGEGGSMEFATVRREKALRVVYTFVPEEQGVYRRGLTRAQVLGFEEEPRPRQEIAGVANFTLAFFGTDNETGTLAFLDVYDSNISGGLPRAVKISIGLEDGTRLERIVSSPLVGQQGDHD